MKGLKASWTAVIVLFPFIWGEKYICHPLVRFCESVNMRTIPHKGNPILTLPMNGFKQSFNTNVLLVRNSESKSFITTMIQLQSYS